jgi:hypothetical protein
MDPSGPLSVIRLRECVCHVERHVGIHVSSDGVSMCGGHVARDYGVWRFDTLEEFG